MRATSLNWADREIPGLGAPRLIAPGRGHIDHGPHLVKGDLARTQRTPPGGAGRATSRPRGSTSGPSPRTSRRPRRSRPRPRWPRRRGMPDAGRTRRGRSVNSPSATVLTLSASVMRALSSSSQQSRHRADQVGAGVRSHVIGGPGHRRVNSPRRTKHVRDRPGTRRQPMNRVGPLSRPVPAGGRIPNAGRPRPTPPAIHPRTKMWSIWLCGLHVGHVGPTTARCQPGMNRRTNGPHVFMSPASSASGRARCAVRAVAPPNCGASPCADATCGARHRNRPSRHRHIDHQCRPRRPVGTQRAHRDHPRDSIGQARAARIPRSPGSRLRPPASGPSLHPRRHGRTPSMYSALFSSFQMGRASQLSLGVRLRPDPAPGAERVAPRSGTQVPGRLRRLPTTVVPGQVQASSSTMTSASSAAIAAT